MVHSIEAYCSGLPSNHNGVIRFQFNSSSSLVDIEFRVRYPFITLMGVNR